MCFSQFHATQRHKIGHLMFPSTACGVAVESYRACLSGITAKCKTWAMGSGESGNPRVWIEEEPICRNDRYTDGGTGRGSMSHWTNVDSNFREILELCAPRNVSLGLNTCSNTTECHAWKCLGIFIAWWWITPRSGTGSWSAQSSQGTGRS